MLEIEKFHKQEYGVLPEISVIHGGSFHILGELCDFLNLPTLSVSVNLPLYLSLSPRKDSGYRFYDSVLKESRRSTFSGLKFKKEDRWTNYLKAAIYSFLKFGLDLKGLNVSVLSRIPHNSGIDSGAAMFFCMGYALKNLYVPEMSSENFYSVLREGCENFMSFHFSAADFCRFMGGTEGCFVLTNPVNKSWEKIPVDSDEMLVLTDSGLSFLSSKSEIESRENKCSVAFSKFKKIFPDISPEDYTPGIISESGVVLSEEERRAVLYIIKEIQAVKEGGAALYKSDMAGFSKVLNNSHQGLRDLFEISCPEVDWLVRRVQELEGASCSRLIGRGLRGCTFSMMKKEVFDIYMEKLEEYERIFGFHPAIYRVKTSDSIKIL